MKKILGAFFIFCSVVTVSAQNIQLIGGYGVDKSTVNFATFELLKPLKHGLFYGFTDFKLGNNGYYESYTEVSKYWNIDKVLSITAQYNGGLNKDFEIKPIFLFGVSRAGTIGKLNISFDALYRYQKELITYKEGKWGHNGFQLTFNFSRDWDHFQVSGYTDIWNDGYYIFEPQAWWKFSKQVFLGAEGRLSNWNDLNAPVLDDYTKYFMVGLKWCIE